MTVQSRCSAPQCQMLQGRQHLVAFRSAPAIRRLRRDLRVRADTESEPQTADSEELESESARLKREADRLRAAERFMMIGTGEADCKGCGYTYTPSKGDSEYPVAPGTRFESLPEDWQCPVCSADKKMFESRQREVAGFAENQGYGLGTNAMTGEQKSLLIFGSLGALFFLFLLGYTMN